MMTIYETISTLWEIPVSETLSPYMEFYKAAISSNDNHVPSNDARYCVLLIAVGKVQLITGSEQATELISELILIPQVNLGDNNTFEYYADKVNSLDKSLARARGSTETDGVCAGRLKNLLKAPLSSHLGLKSSPSAPSIGLAYLQYVGRLFVGASRLCTAGCKCSDNWCGIMAADIDKLLSNANSATFAKIACVIHEGFAYVHPDEAWPFDERVCSVHIPIKISDSAECAEAFHLFKDHSVMYANIVVKV